MTITTPSVLRALEPVTFDLYRDVHKGIRTELFAVTTAAGNVDPSDDAGRADLARYVHSVAELLTLHAEHEDGAAQPLIEQHLPLLAEQIAVDHPALESRIVEIGFLADRAVEAPVFTRREDMRRIYVELASFTSAYLAHQDFEERDVMPALEQAIGLEAVIGIHQAIIGSIPPDQMARSLALMLPAMNVDDRTDLLGGMKQGAPPDVFAQVWGLARSVLVPADAAALAKRLEIS